jgi:hypothetical protein
MARIVKMEQLLPEDISFEMPDGRVYVAPGDPPLQLILKIASLFEQAQNEDGTAEEIGIDLLRQLDEEVVGLLQMRDPTITASPFGVIGVQHFVSQLLAAYNFGVEGADGPPTKTRTAKKTSASSRASSRRSSG